MVATRLTLSSLNAGQDTQAERSTSGLLSVSLIEEIEPNRAEQDIMAHTGLVEGRLSCDKAQARYTLDGFPSDGDQAKALDDREIDVERVISLVAPNEILVQGPCGQAYQRKGDVEEVIESRLQVYQDQTAPLITHYKAAGLLRTIEGNRAVDEGSVAILETLE